MPVLKRQVAFKSVKSVVLNNYISDLEKAYISLITNIPVTLPNDTRELIDLHIEVTKHINDLANVKFPPKPTNEDIKKAIKDWFDQNMSDYNTTLQSLEQNRDSIVNSAKQEYIKSIEHRKAQYADIIQQYKNRLSVIYEPIKSIKENQKQIENFAHNCGVTLSSYNINYTEMSLSEIKELAVIAKVALDYVLSGTKGINILTLLLYFPLFYNPFEKDLSSSVVYKYFYFLILCILVIFTKPFVIGTISLLIIVQAVGNLIVNRRNIELLSVIYQISDKYTEFDLYIESVIKQEKDLKKLEQEILDLESLNLNDVILEATQEIDDKIKAHKLTSKENSLKEDIGDIKSYSIILYECEESRKKINEKYIEYMSNLKKYYSQICKALKQKSDNVKPPGLPVNAKRYMLFDIKTSVIVYQDKLLDYFSIKLPFKNILFKYKNIEERAVRIETMKLFLSSILGNVREGNLKVTIIDTEGLGRSFSEFLKKELSQYIKVIHTDWEKEFEKLTKMAHEQMLEIGTKSFNQYNEDNDKEGKITLEYNLVIILSTNTNLWENKTFLEFKKYSTDMGVWLWLLHANESLFIKNKNYPGGLLSLMDFSLIINNKDYIENGREKIPIYLVDKYSKPLGYTINIGKTSVENLIKVFKENRVDIIDYEKEYRLKHIPDDKIWTYSTLDNIELHFGFLDGDRSNPMAETFSSDGTRPVHCLMGGVTGAGKSATINLVLANLLHMYSPEELELIMIDFKNVEFSMYTGKYLIPHAKLIAGTTDGEYALSIFDYLLALMNERKAKFSKYGFQNIMDWNKAVLSKKIDETYMPRVLLLCDEFQVMFSEVEDKIVDIIKSRITSLAKLARFAGLHMWFTSQSMSNTMSADILNQFSMRAALRLNDKETSMDLLGNDAAFSKLKGRGFIYVNCDKGNVESNHKYSIPFASNDYIKQYLLKLIDKCKKENHLHRHADFYDEKKRHNINEIGIWYEYKEVNDKPYICILGEKTFFSTNRLPVHLHFFQDSYQHLIISGIEKEDRYNLVCTILYNIEKHNNMFIASCSDKEFSNLLNLESRIKSNHRDLLNLDNPTKLFEAVKYVIDYRKSDPTRKWAPLYVFCLAWDNMYGIGIGDDYDIADTFKEILQISASLGIHFIISTSQSKPFKTYLPYIKHKICAQADEDTSLDLLDSNKAMKLSNDSLISRMALYKENLNPVKFKIYQAPIDSTKLQEKETIIL